MKRVSLIHWNAEEAKERISQLKSAGYQAVHLDLTGPDVMRKMKVDPPDAYVIDLTRLPSHGRDVGLALREAKATRSIPLVFAGGAPEKITRVQESLPDAIYSSWEKFEAH